MYKTIPPKGMNQKLSLNLLLLSMLLLTACELTKTKKPLNVLWLVAEDLSPDYLSAYGDFRAPHSQFGPLGQRGVVYTHNFLCRAFVLPAAPLWLPDCTPTPLEHT